MNEWNNVSNEPINNLNYVIKTHVIILKCYFIILMFTMSKQGSVGNRQIEQEI